MLAAKPLTEKVISSYRILFEKTYSSSVDQEILHFL